MVDAETAVDPQAVVDLMAALERVFRIGVYYPSGHAMCDRAAEDFLAALERVLGRAPYLRFAVKGEALHMQDVALEEDLRGVAGFREILTDLGITGVTIDSNVSAGEIHQFVRQLVAYRGRVKGARRFQQVEVEDLPLGISVEHLEFTAHEIEPEEDEDEGEGGDPRNPTVETLLGALARRGMAMDQLAQCRRFLEAIPERLAKADLDHASLPQVGWNDVQTLLLRAAGLEPGQDGDGAPRRIGSNVNIDSLTAIFTALSEEAEVENPREAIDLLLNLSRRSLPTEFTAGFGVVRPQPQRCPEIEAWPLQDLRIALEACEVRAEDKIELRGGEVAEELSILLQMLAGEQKLPVQLRIQKRIRDIARGGLRPDEWAVAAGGLADLADPAREERLSAPLIALTDSLRVSAEVSVLAFVRDVAVACAPERRAQIWPFLVNEILVEGPQRDPEAFAEACLLAGNLEVEAMAGGLQRLESLSALREGRTARSAFVPPHPDLADVLAVVLRSKRSGRVGASLCEGLRQRPPNWLAAAIVPLLEDYEPRYRDFLVEVLRLGDDQDAPPALLEAAGRVAAECLPALTHHDGNEPWLPRTLRSLASLSVPGGRAVLQNIIEQRRWLVLPAWPRSCRQAARETLAAWGLPGRSSRKATAPDPPEPPEPPRETS